MATEIQTLEPTQRLSITTQPQNFVGAFQEYALSSNMLGELGSSMALNASIQYNKIQGEKLGLTPQGDILPPITTADKAFAEGYVAQSNATLSLQANQMMMQGALELEKNYKITPDGIASYNQNMQQGLQKIIEQAPTQIQNDLRNNLSSSLMQQTEQFTKRYLSQSKQQQTSEAQANLQLQLKNMQDQIRSGNSKEAEKTKDKIISESNARKSTGMYDPVTAQTAIDSANNTYHTAKEIVRAQEAINQKKVPEYLDSIATSNVQGLGATDSDAVKNNVYNYINKVQAFRQQEQSLLMTQARNDMINGTFNDIKAAQLQASLDPINYLNTMTQWSSMQKKKGVDDAIVQSIMSEPNNALSYVGATKKQINAAFDAKVNQRQNQQNGSESLIDSQFAVAASMNRPVPKIIDSINSGLTSGNPQQIEALGNLYYRLNDLSPTHTAGVSNEALAVHSLYKYNLDNATYKNDPNLAAAEALKQVYNKDEMQIKNNTKSYNTYMDKNAKNTEKLSSWALTTSGLPSSIPITNRTGFNIDMQRTFQGFWHATDGNEEVAKKLTQDYANRYYGTTTVNGTKELVKFPIGKSINLEYGADSLIQEDAVNQISQQFALHKQIYDEGKIQYYYEFKEKPNFSEYEKAKSYLRENGGVFYSTIKAIAKGEPDKERIANQKIVDDFENPKPLTVIQKFKNGTQKEMQMFLQPSPNMVIGSDGNMIGDYLPMFIDQITGVPVQFRGVFGPNRQSPSYRVNSGFIQKRYIAVNGIVAKSFAELIKLRDERRQFEQAAIEATTFGGLQ